MEAFYDHMQYCVSILHLGFQILSIVIFTIDKEILCFLHLQVNEDPLNKRKSSAREPDALTEIVCLNNVLLSSCSYILQKSLTRKLINQLKLFKFQKRNLKRKKKKVWIAKAFHLSKSATSIFISLFFNKKHSYTVKKSIKNITVLFYNL